MAKVLTQRSIETAKPRAKRYGKADGLVPGHRLIIHPSGEKTFALFARVDGRLVNFRIGSAKVVTLSHARAEARRKLASIAGGEDPRVAKQEAIRTAAETVEVVARHFIERHARPKLRTWREVQWRLEREVLPHWGPRPIASITKRDVIKLLDAIVDRGVAVSANRTLTIARKMFNWALARSLIEHSPFDRIRAPAQEVPRDRALTDSELALGWRASDKFTYPFGAFFKLMVLTGQRREEVAGMRWAELDPDLTTWLLGRERVKNAQPHQVPIVPEVRRILADIPRISDLVFSTNGRTSISGFSRAKRALDAAIAQLNNNTPIAPWRLHDLRRTMASKMAGLGVQLPVIEKLLNHTSGTFGGVQGIYQRHTFHAEKRAALELWTQHVLALGIRP